MKGPFSGEAGKDWCFGEGPFHFSGPPRACRGQVELTNLGEQKVKVRELAVRAPSRLRKGVLGLEEGLVLLEARLRPGDSGRFQARLMVPASTAPGQYEAEFSLSGIKARLRVEILEQRALVIEPAHIRTAGASGDKVSGTVRVRNLGNVAVSVADGAQVWLRERDWIGRTLVYSLRDTEESDDYETFANRLLHNFRESLIPPATVRFSPRGALSAGAGEVVERTFSITLPPGIQKGRHYLGFIKICDDRIWIELYCNGAPVSTKRR
ncbi:hypothetical protein QQM79_16705 [Marinobacteraceae bacterium S3BR75-40.1]